MNIKPIGSQILVRLLKTPEPGPGELYIPGNATGPKRALIVALGSGNRNERGHVSPFEVSVDDIVLLGQHAGIELKHEGDKYLLLREDDILGIVQEKA